MDAPETQGVLGFLPLQEGVHARVRPFPRRQVERPQVPLRGRILQASDRHAVAVLPLERYRWGSQTRGQLPLVEHVHLERADHPTQRASPFVVRHIPVRGDTLDPRHLPETTGHEQANEHSGPTDRTPYRAAYQDGRHRRLEAHVAPQKQTAASVDHRQKAIAASHAWATAPWRSAAMKSCALPVSPKVASKNQTM